MKKIIILSLFVFLISFISVNAIENYEALKLINVTQIGYTPEALRLNNDILYILNYEYDKLITYNVSDIYNPVHLQTFTTCNGGQDLFLKNNFVYIACYDDSKLSIINATNPSDMNEISSYYNADLFNAKDVFVDNRNIAFIVSGEFGTGALVSLNVSNSENIVFLDEINNTEISGFRKTQRSFNGT